LERSREEEAMIYVDMVTGCRLNWMERERMIMEFNALQESRERARKAFISGASRT
jgi:hypothetical protein